jgi:hypothetical protein
MRNATVPKIVPVSSENRLKNRAARARKGKLNAAVLFADNDAGNTRDQLEQTKVTNPEDAT